MMKTKLRDIFWVCIPTLSYQSNDKTKDTKDYVLGKFTKEEMDLINPIIDEMPNIIEDYLKLPFDNVMNKYN